MEKGIKAYHSYLSFGDAKEALSETVCEGKECKIGRAHV